MNSQAKVWKTILVLILANLIAFVIWRFQILVYVAIGLGLLSLLSPQLVKWIHTTWMNLAEYLGWINSRILLTAVFFLLLTPIALIVRLFQKDILQLKKSKNDSMFIERNHLFRRADLKNMW
ncbi:MAG: SxtJ family membrane protein [Bacteroidota bacterium]